MEPSVNSSANHAATAGRAATKSARRPRLPVPRNRSPLGAVRRFNSLITKFTFELRSASGREVTAFEREMIRQAAAMMLRAERLQAELVYGAVVDPDELIRVTSETRRYMRALGLKPPPTPSSSSSALELRRQRWAAQAEAKAKSQPPCAEEKPSNA